MDQSISADLLVFTRDYCIKQLLRALRIPCKQYFHFLYQCAAEDAKDDKRPGELKQLVKFQERVQRIHTYTEDKLQRITKAFQEENSFPLNALVKTILLSNAMIIGSFSQERLERRDILIPSDTQFVHALLKNAGKSYFADPQAALGIDGRMMDIDLIADSIERTLEELIPLEALVQPITGASRFNATASGKEFAQHMIQNAEHMDADGVHNAAMGQSESAYDSFSEPSLMSIRGYKPPQMAPREPIGWESPVEESDADDEYSASSDDLGFA